MPGFPKKPLESSIWRNKAPGLFKGLTKWFSKPHTKRGNVSNLLRWRFRGQWKVGEDYLGNEYYLYQPFPETPIRRFCIFREGQIGMDELPFLWYQWIRYQRNYPPTDKELNDYDLYLEKTYNKAQDIKKRDQQQRITNAEYYDEQKKKFEDQQNEFTNKAQREVIEMFSARENALRIAAENKLAKMQEADNIIHAERQRYEELQFNKSKQEFHDPNTVEPTGGTQQQPFEPGKWRPWSDDNDNNDDANVNK